MTNVEVKFIADATQVVESAAQLRAAFRLPEQQLLKLIDNLKALAVETTKLVSLGIGPTKDGLAHLTAGFRTTAGQAESLVATIRGLQTAQVQANQGIAGTIEALAAERAQRALAVQQLQAELGLRERMTLQRRAEQQNARVDLPINQFLAVMHGGQAGLDRFKDSAQAVQGSLALFGSTVMARPVESLRVLMTDTRAAGAAMQYLKGQLDFVIGSRFGAIAIGFAVFGTIEETIRRSIMALVEFEQKFARIQALSVGNADAFNISARAQQFIQEAALKTGVSLVELADKYLIAASATASETAAQGLFTNALRFSVATGADFRQTILMLSGVLNTFGNSLGTSLTETEKLQVLTSKLFTTFRISRGEADDFVAALNMVAATASNSNISFDRLLGVLGGLADKMQEGSRGGRGFGQVLSTIIREADRFNSAFNLGLTPRQITEAPLAAIEALRQQIEAGTIDAARFTAEVADLFPQNAARVFLSLQQLTTAEVGRYTNELKNATNIQEVANKALENTATQWGITKRISELSVSGMIGGSKTLGEVLQNIVNPALAITGQSLVIIGTGIGLAAVAAGGLAIILTKIATLRFKEAADLFGALQDELIDIAMQAAGVRRGIDNMGKGFDEQSGKVKAFTNILNEANTAQEAAARAKMARGGEGQAATEGQRLEIDLARGLTVELDRQLTVREEAVRKAEEAFRVALGTKNKEQAKSQLVTALDAFRQTQLKGLQEANERILLQSERLTERTREQGAVSQEAAQQEITARRGILAALQGQEAQVELLVRTQQISALEGERWLVQLQRQQNAQLQAIQQVTNAVRQGVEQRIRAEEAVVQAQERLQKTQQALVEQQRHTLEIGAVGAVRAFLAVNQDANASLLTQLDLIRHAQTTANLPLQERISLLQKELDTLDKIRGKEESRLDLEIQQGAEFARKAEEQRKQVEEMLRSDPIRQAAAERKAALQGMATAEGAILAAARALNLKELTAHLEGTKEVRERELQEIQNINQRRVELERLMNAQLAEEVARSTQLELERAEGIRKANTELAKALEERGRLHEQARLAAEAAQRAQAFEGLPASSGRPRFLSAVDEFGNVRRVPDFPLSPSEIVSKPLIVEIAPGSFSNAPVFKELGDAARALKESAEMQQKLLDAQERGRAIFPEDLPIIRPQSSPQHERLMQDFNAGWQEISRGMAENFTTPIRDATEEARQLRAILKEVATTIPPTARALGRPITESVKQMLIDDVARELAYPTL